MSQTQNMHQYYLDIIEVVKNSDKSNRRKKVECETYLRMVGEDFHNGKRLTQEEYDEIVAAFNAILEAVQA